MLVEDRRMRVAVRPVDPEWEFVDSCSFTNPSQGLPWPNASRRSADMVTSLAGGLWFVFSSIELRRFFRVCEHQGFSALNIGSSHIHIQRWLLNGEDGEAGPQTAEV